MGKLSHIFVNFQKFYGMFMIIYYYEHILYTIYNFQNIRICIFWHIVCCGCQIFADVPWRRNSHTSLFNSCNFLRGTDIESIPKYFEWINGIIKTFWSLTTMFPWIFAHAMGNYLQTIVPRQLRSIPVPWPPMVTVLLLGYLD